MGEILFVGNPDCRVPQWADLFGRQGERPVSDKTMYPTVMTPKTRPGSSSRVQYRAIRIASETSVSSSTVGGAAWIARVPLIVAAMVSLLVCVCVHLEGVKFGVTVVTLKDTSQPDPRRSVRNFDPVLTSDASGFWKVTILSAKEPARFSSPKQRHSGVKLAGTRHGGVESARDGVACDRRDREPRSLDSLNVATYWTVRSTPAVCLAHPERAAALDTDAGRAESDSRTRMLCVAVRHLARRIARTRF